MLRSKLVAARAGRPAAEIEAAELALAETGAAAWSTCASVTAYAAVDTEPPTRLLLDRLRTSGVTVLLPVVVGAELHWAPYETWDVLAPGRFGLLEPTGPVQDGDPVAAADVVVVPALAVDERGHRLGRGGGYVDRAIAGIDPVHVVAVVYDDEVLPEVPVEQHDRRVGAVLTPAGLRPLGSVG